VAFGLPHNPDPIPLVRRTGVDCSQHTPLRIIPHFGKITEDSGKSSSHKHRAVFHKYLSRSNFTDDSCHMSPHGRSLSVDSCAFSGARYVLTGKASRNDINTASPLLSVKRLNVIPDRERRENTVVLSADENTGWVGFPLDGAYGSPSEQMPSEYSATSACE
jgi:hypothetical protein